MNPIPCRCCGQPLTQIVYPALMPGRPDRIKVECRVRSCAAFMITLGIEDYASIDLSAYRQPAKSGKVQAQARTA